MQNVSNPATHTGANLGEVRFSSSGVISQFARVSDAHHFSLAVLFVSIQMYAIYILT